MRDLVSRSVSVLKHQGIQGLVKSAGAYTYNRGLFRLLIGGRAAYYRKRGHAGFQNPYRPLWIDPAEITHIYQGCFNQKIYLGQIKSGTWDEERRQITESQVYKGLKQRFCEEYSWENTVYYQRAVDRIRNGKTVMGYRSVDGFENRLEYVDRLYENINKNGYRSQRELTDEDWDSQRHPIVTPAHEQVGEVGVNIGRDGTIMQNDGIHRLVIAKLKKIDEIPVQVIVRHREWQRTRDNIVRSNDLTRHESRYIEHPDVEVIIR